MKACKGYSSYISVFQVFLYIVVYVCICLCIAYMHVYVYIHRDEIFMEAHRDGQALYCCVSYSSKF